MNIQKIVEKALNKANFTSLQNYIDFAKEYLEFVAHHLQATIVSQNENNYQFYQYGKEGNYQITRPINSKLMYSADTFESAIRDFIEILPNLKAKSPDFLFDRMILNKVTYTLQQSIGAALDGIGGGQANATRKINGDLFERLIRVLLLEMKVDAISGVVQIPVTIDNAKAFDMSYQHDLIVKDGDSLKLLGSVKTSSKDRIDKIFIDKFLYNRLTGTSIPHIAVFLNDVQRKNTNKENNYGISSTFLPGHFKGYTIKLNPLDGVYYCDIRPNMLTETILKDHIKTFDHLLVNDIWKLISDDSITSFPHNLGKHNSIDVVVNQNNNNFYVQFLDGKTDKCAKIPSNMDPKRITLEEGIKLLGV